MDLDICDVIKSKEHIIISISSILLQGQLINDIKSISEMLHLYPEVVLVKGMTHFKCLKRTS